MKQQSSGASLTGEIYRRGGDGYDRHRLAPSRAVDWNAREVDRYPEVVVVARDDADVQAAVRYARRNRLKVKARSGGHSWADSSIRDGVLIDLSNFTELQVDPEARTAIVGPGIKSQELNPVLAPHGLYFPTGGCLDVGFGGFILQGGFGFNGSQVGMACASVYAMDIVNAEGDLIHADEQTSSDYFWAARGSGAGFFGVVTRFYVRVHELPKVVMGCGYSYSIDDVDAVLPWLLGLYEKGLPAGMGLGMFVMPKYQDTTPRATGPVMNVMGNVVTDDEATARDALALMETCPVRDRALTATPASVAPISASYEICRYIYPDGLTYVADNMWSDAPAGELIPHIKRVLGTFPTRRSHLLLEATNRPSLPDMAFSMLGKYYVATYGVRDVDDEITDAELAEWTTSSMRSMEHLSKGIQLADENLVARRWPFMSEQNFRRLEKLRDRYDPDGVFHSYLMAPGPTDAMV